jgi:hypothetical protein
MVYVMQVHVYCAQLCEFAGWLIHAYNCFESFVDALGSLGSCWGYSGRRVFGRRCAFGINQILDSLTIRSQNVNEVTRKSFFYAHPV